MKPQRDMFPSHPPETLARANREAAKAALVDWHYSESERVKRAAHYTAIAEGIEAGLSKT